MTDTQLEKDLQECLPSSTLLHGGYYNGKCRNATVARWNSETRQWAYWRTKFGSVFVDRVQAMEDAGENRFDYFAPRSPAPPTEKEIPL